MTPLADFLSLRYSAGGHPLTRALSQPAGAWLAWLGARLRLSPSTVTLAGLLAFVVAGLLYAALPPGPASALACGVLFQLGYALDCADGQLARATGTASAFGSWLDLASDYCRCVVVAIAALHWLLAGALLPAAAAAAGLFLAGGVVHIHTAAVLRGAAPPPTAAAPGPARWAATLILDTATVLLVLALLRDAPGPLAAYLAGMGALYGAVALRLARQRLR